MTKQEAMTTAGLYALNAGIWSMMEVVTVSTMLNWLSMPRASIIVKNNKDQMYGAGIRLIASG
jgi:hypothetical protein